MIETLHVTSNKFFNRNIGAAVVGKLNPKTGMNDLITPVDAIPDDVQIDWGVAIGHIAHDLRAALDGLIYQLAVDSGASDTELGKTQFPIFLKGRISGCRGRCNRKPPHLRCNGRNMIAPLKSGYRACIEKFQPYKRGNGHRRSPLFLLHELNNADKHRIVHLARGYVSGSMAVLRGPGSVGPFSLKAGMPHKAKTKIGEIDLSRVEVNMYFEATHQIAFGDGCSAIKGLPVIRTLNRIRHHVSGIIESFAEEFPQ